MKQDAEKLSEILTRMHEEDPTWVIEQSKELKQTIVSGQRRIPSAHIEMENRKQR